MSDNELDDLFKEAAEGFKPPQDSSAWEQMAARLDQAAPVSGFWNWKTISALTVTGIIAITATWYATAPQQELQTKIDTQHGSNNATSGVVQEQKEQTHTPGKQNLAPAKLLESKGAGNDGVGMKSKNLMKKDWTEANSSPATVGTATRTEEYYTVIQTPVRMNENSRADNRSTSVAEKDSSPDSEISSATTVSELHDASLNAKAQDSVSLLSADVQTDSIENSDSGKNTRGTEKIKSRSGFSIKLAVSPDFSSVNYFSASKPGVNFGILAGYSFNSRWSVYSGIISSKKLYKSKDVDKSYSQGGHDYPVKELDGDCRIIDIPVTVYYSFFPERSFSLKAGLGFSSYLMRKETYNYCVDNYGAEAFYEQRITGENNEWFKILNVSVIAGKKLTNRLSAEFEPFVKAPLAGVGEGKVSLVSMGAFINLKLDLSNKNNK